MIQSLINSKTEEYQSAKKYVLSDTINWFWLNNTTWADPKEDDKYDNFGFYTHTIIDRTVNLDADVLLNQDSYKSIQYQPYFFPRVLDEVNVSYFHNVVVQILKENNIDLNVIYRMACNCVHPTLNNKPSFPHVDHEYSHKNLLIYFNDTQGGQTVVGEEEYYGKEDDVILFEGEHYHYPPTQDRRIVLVTTFI